MRLLAIGSAVALSSSAFVAVPTPAIASSQASQDAPDTYIVDLFAAPPLDEAVSATEDPEPAPVPESLPAPESTPAPNASESLPPADQAPASTSENGVASTEGVSAHGDVTYSESRITTLSRGFGNAVVPGDESVTTLDVSTDVYDLFTAPLAVEEYSVAGITWSGNWPASVEIRVEVDGEWLDWYSLEMEKTADGNGATEPYMAAGASGIQVRAQYATAPSDFQVHLETGVGNGGTEEEADVEVADEQPAPSSTYEEATNDSDAVQPTSLLSDLARIDNASLTMIPKGVIAPDFATTLSAPKVVSRSEWGAPAKASWRPTTVKLTGAIIHHTAGTNTYTQAQSADLVRGIWNYHTFGQGWGDIGYNFLVDKYGTIYEGREGTLTAQPGYMSVGAHAAPANTNSVGISVMGEYTKIQPTTESIDSVVDVLAWQFSMANINPLGTRTYTTNAGATKTISTVAGHKDVSATACPGLIYNQLGAIRHAVAEKLSVTDAPLSTTAQQYPIEGVINAGAVYATTRQSAIRISPYPTAAAVKSLASGEPVVTKSRSIRNTYGAWWNVELNNNQGWISYADLVGLSKHPDYRTRSAENLWISDFTYAFNVPSRSGVREGSVNVGDYIRTTGIRFGDFVEMESGNGTQWILQARTSTIYPANLSTNIASGREYSTKRDTKIYAQPLTSSGTVFSLAKDTMVLTASRSARVDGIAWYAVRLGSRQGWVKYRDLQPSTANPKYSYRNQSGAWRTAAANGTIYSTASQFSSALANVSSGVAVKLTGDVYGYYSKVSYGDVVGWISTVNLR